MIKMKDLIAQHEAEKDKMHREIKKEFDEAMYFVESIEKLMQDCNAFGLIWTIELLSNELKNRSNIDGNLDEHTVFNIVAQLPYSPDEIILAANKLKDIDDEIE